MKKTVFILAYIATLALGVFLYLKPFGTDWLLLLQEQPSYMLSISFGVIAFTIIANQFLLASRPRFFVEALGTKGLLAFHSTMPSIALLLALLHRVLKINVLGFSDTTLQASFGAITLILILVAMLIAALFMATTFWLRIPMLKSLKSTVIKKLHLDYKKLRFLHNLTVIVAFTLLIHILSASTADFQANPLASIWVGAWMFLCLGSYLSYRLRSRRSKNIS